ncbi:MAG: hypothetical protein M3336_08880, partial [Chloroflexota bacterium]|nr:hypothetical protein [Chloroflexota bacterium]
MLRWFGRGKKQPHAAPVTVHVSAAARQQLLAVLQRQSEPAALRILVHNPGGAVPQYDMALEPMANVRPDETLIDLDGVRIVVGPESVAAVAGAHVDFNADPLRPGFVI